MKFLIKGLLSVLMALSAVTISSEASAADASIVECRSCDSATRLALAENTALGKWNPGTHLTQEVFVFDPGSTFIAKFTVDVLDDFREPMYWDRGGALVYSTESQVPPELVEYRQIIAQGLRIQLPPDSQYPINAYQDIENPIYAERVNNYLMSISGPSMRTVSLLDALLGMVGFELSKFGKIFIIVNYAGGQKRTYVFDQSNRKFVPVPNTGKDDSGNRVPETRADIAPDGGTIEYTFNPNHPVDIQDFFDKMSLFNVPIYNSFGTRIVQPPSKGGGIVCSGPGYDKICIYTQPELTID